MNDLLAGLNGGNVPALDLIFMITLVALLPSIAVMMTSFTRTAGLPATDNAFAL